MKTFILVLTAAIVLVFSQFVFAVSTGGSTGVNITTEQFAPRVWLCDHRIVIDDNTEPGRISPGGTELVERINNYAFEGEQIHWTVLAMDKNGINKLQDVYGTAGTTQGAGNPIEVNCRENLTMTRILPSCNAMIDEENITTFDPTVMRYYDCTLTVETSQSMYGKYWLTVEATDLSGLSGTMAENEYWFLNPVIAISVDGTLNFPTTRPGTDSYSNTILVGNDADSGSGVLLDMFISGTDFYDSASEGAMCPTTNQLSLSNFRYYATNGAYSTATDLQIGRQSTGAAIQPPRNCDAQGYCNIGYGIGFNNPSPFYNGFEIIQDDPMTGPYYLPNILAPGSQMPITFKLSLPEPCNGNFNTGSIYFWGEAI